MLKRMHFIIRRCISTSFLHVQNYCAILEHVGISWYVDCFLVTTFELFSKLINNFINSNITLQRHCILLVFSRYDFYNNVLCATIINTSKYIKIKHFRKLLNWVKIKFSLSKISTICHVKTMFFEISISENAIWISRVNNLFPDAATRIRTWNLLTLSDALPLSYYGFTVWKFFTRQKHVAYKENL